MVASPQSGTRPRRTTGPIDPNTRSAALEMERALGTRVKIVGGETRGKIEISYFSAEDLQRLYELLTHNGQRTNDRR